MSLFNFFKSTQLPSNGFSRDQETIHREDKSNEFSQQRESKSSPEVPEDVFVEYAKPKAKNMDTGESKSEVNDIHILYNFLEQNLEKKGYEDALVNPDTSYMEEHIKYINNELNLLIAKITTYYSGYMRMIDFHIETRKRSGMLETVDELLAHKATITEEIAKVNAIEQQSIKGEGLSQNLVLSYKNGFRNGFAAITYNNVLSRRS